VYNEDGSVSYEDYGGGGGGATPVTKPFTYTGGLQEFTVDTPIIKPDYILVGNTSLQLTQFTWSGSTFTITDTLTNGAVIEIGYWDDTTFINSIAPDGVIESGNLEAVSGDKIYDFNQFSIKEAVNVTNGFYINTSGVLVAGSSWNYTNYIKINPSGNYFLSLVANLGVYAILTYYDINKVRLSSVDATVSYTYTKEKLTTPPNAYFVRLSMNNSSLAAFDFKIDGQSNSKVLSEEEELPTTYIDLTSLTNREAGFYFQPSGSVASLGSYSIIDLFKINPKGNYYLSLKDNGNGGYTTIGYYDINRNRISGVINSNLVVYSKTLLSIPSNAYYITFTIYNNDYSTFVLYTDEKVAAYITHTDLSSLSKDLFVSKYFDAVLNEDTNIFLDNLSIFASTKLETIGGSPSILRVNRSLRVNPTSMVADMVLNLVNPKNDNITSCLVRTIPKIVGDGTVQKNIMMVGDSLTDNEYLSQEIFSKLNADGDYIINQIGTRGTIAKHEGRGGWLWSKYVHEPTYAGITNPFIYNGVLDFNQYCIDNSFSGLDIVLINLGTNDVSIGKSKVSNTKINSIITDAKMFIDAILSSYPSCKISIGLQAVGAPEFPTADRSANAFRESIGLLNQAYVTNFDNGTYNANVTTHNRHTTIDREWSYVYVDEPISARNANTWRKYTDAVHPQTVGYLQFADSDYSKIRAFLNGML